MNLELNIQKFLFLFLTLYHLALSTFFQILNFDACHISQTLIFLRKENYLHGNTKFRLTNKYLEHVRYPFILLPWNNGNKILDENGLHDHYLECLYKSEGIVALRVNFFLNCVTLIPELGFQDACHFVLIQNCLD